MHENNKRIAKNTLFLYIRMLLTMGISLYTSRVVLATLGIEDYGIYNVVGGVVVLLSFLSSALTQATQRFLTIELGKDNLLQFNKIFSLSLLVYVALALFVILMAETVGLWFLNTQLNIASNRMNATNWVYQFSILIFVFGLLQTPYNASIIAHEKMSFYAYMSILDVVLKLAVVFYLTIVHDFDKLILFSILLSTVSFIGFIIYHRFCIIKYSECRYKHCWDNNLFKQLLSFSGWSMFGSMSVVATNQGVNILLNVFYGVIANAAMGITNQVSSAVNQFVSNFQIAFNPRITKSYVENNDIYLESLIFRSAKLSFYLFLILSLPIFIETKTILSMWLHTVPEYTVEFVRCILLASLIDTLSGPLWMVVQATGKIKKYQLIISSIFWLNFILSFVLFKIGFSPVSVFVVRVVISSLLLFVRLYLLSGMIQFKSKKFIMDVFVRCVVVGTIAFILPCLSSLCYENLHGLLLVCIVSLISSLTAVYIFGLKESERKMIHVFVSEKLNYFNLL